MFHGPANLENKTISHLETVILPIVDNISRSLGLPPRSFVISISNVGASATKGVGLNIAGFSADVPLFLSMLSASMQASLRQDIIATGHIASLAGGIVPVLGIPAKAIFHRTILVSTGMGVAVERAINIVLTNHMEFQIG